MPFVISGGYTSMLTYSEENDSQSLPERLVAPWTWLMTSTDLTPGKSSTSSSMAQTLGSVEVPEGSYLWPIDQPITEGEGAKPDGTHRSVIEVRLDDVRDAGRGLVDRRVLRHAKSVRVCDSRDGSSMGSLRTRSVSRARPGRRGPRPCGLPP